jgi:hypothetical protein
MLGQFQPMLPTLGSKQFSDHDWLLEQSGFAGEPPVFFEEFEAASFRVRGIA